VHQKGSLVAPDRLRFDFAHDAALSAEDRREIESRVNAEIYRNTAVVTEEQDTADAMKAGAMALFRRKIRRPRARRSRIPASAWSSARHARARDRRHRAVRDSSRNLAVVRGWCPPLRGADTRPASRNSERIARAPKDLSRLTGRRSNSDRRGRAAPGLNPAPPRRENGAD
jgi:hypothetical protein